MKRGNIAFSIFIVFFVFTMVLLIITTKPDTTVKDAINLINEQGAEEFTEEDAKDILGCFGKTSVKDVAQAVLDKDLLVSDILEYYNFRNLYHISMYSLNDNPSISDITSMFDNLFKANKIYKDNKDTYITKQEYISSLAEYAEDKNIDISEILNDIVTKKKEAEIIDIKDDGSSVRDKNKQGLERIQAILNTDVEELHINKLIELYNSSDKAQYNELNNKHLRLTGYVKNTGEMELAYVYIDSQDMKSRLGSKMAFTAETNHSDILGLEQGQKVVIDGIGNTTGITFSMYECTLVEAGNLGIDKTEFIELDINAARRNPSDWDRKLVYFSGTIDQVIPAKITSLTLNDRYIVSSGDNKISFYYKGDTNYLEGDKVTVYGTFTGLCELKSVLGKATTAPDIEAMEINID